MLLWSMLKQLFYSFLLVSLVVISPLSSCIILYITLARNNDNYFAVSIRLTKHASNRGIIERGTVTQRVQAPKKREDRNLKYELVS